MGAIFAKEESNDAAVKRQAEGASNPMYQLVNLVGGGLLYDLAKKAMLTKNYKELDDTLRQRLPPYLYNNGKGAWIHCAHIACLRNRDRPKFKQFEVLKALGDELFTYKFDGSEVLAKLTEGHSPETHPQYYTQHCWDIECRGAVGETAFHVCFLQGTAIHLHLAKRMLKFFPLLLNDIYLSDEYYGENVLHMSCVAEDPSIVKWLLDIGADIERRCYGNFFTCDDQKKGRTDSTTQEEVVLPVKTDYMGYVAWGEYPHNFAAVLNQEECYRLILAKGGNHDLQDINGCTVAHILVVYDNMKMFDMAVECGAAINIENNVGLTPLTMAAYLARMEMFFHIASIEREVYWQIGNVTCSAYPLKYLDTIHSETGELQINSALNLIVFGPKIEHLDLIEYVVVDLLNVKYKTFVRRVFLRQLVTFVLFFLLSSYCFILRPSLVRTSEAACYLNKNLDTLTNLTFLDFLDPEDNEEEEGPDLDGGQLGNLTNLDSLDAKPPDLDGIEAETEESLTSLEVNRNGTLNVNKGSKNATTAKPGKKKKKEKKKKKKKPKEIEEEEDDDDDSEEEECKIPYQYLNHCYLQEYDTLGKQVRLVCEIIYVLWSVIYLVEALHELSHLGRKIFLDNLSMCPSRVGFLFGCFLSLINVPARIFCLQWMENNLAIIIMLFTGWYFLYFCRGFKLVGPMVIMIYRMCAQDLAKFGIVFVIFLMSFSQALYIIFQSHKFVTDDEDIMQHIKENEGECPSSASDDDCMENPMPNAVESIMVTFLMSLGDMFEVWKNLSYTNHQNIGRIHWAAFVMIVYLLLVNLLIAMMGDTYAKIAEIKNEWMRQWAKIVLITERGLTPKERLKQQNAYCDINSFGEKALVMKQFLSDEKVDEITEIIEMKITHRKNIERRKAKFGYDSVSKMGLNMVGASVIVPDSSDGTDPENPYGDDLTASSSNKLADKFSA